MLNPIEEAKFRDLKDKCRELKVPAPPEVHIGLQVHEGGILTFDDIQRGHSWTRNFYNWMFSQLTQSVTNGSSWAAGNLNAKTTAGSIKSSASYGAGLTGWSEMFSGNGYGYRAAAGSAAGGIVVGTSDTAFSAEHHALGEIIAEGTGAGQFSYQASPSPTSSYNAGTDTWTATIARIMNNNSGGSITVKEAGLYWCAGNLNFATFFGGGAESHLTERSLLDPTVAVANGAQLTVTYEISMDFSAIDS